MRAAHGILALVFLAMASLVTGQAFAQARTVATTENSDYFGFDLRTEPNVSLDRCKTICLADEGCRAFTYNTKAKWCFLKSDFNTIKPFTGAVAGKVVNLNGDPDIDTFYLIDTAVMPLSAWQAIAISLLSIAAVWAAYNGLCRSPAAARPALLAALVLALIMASAFLFSQVYSGRGAFIHVGVVIGTIMAANVFMVIIPNQRRITAALIRGEPPDPALGATGKQRSLHNTYLTLPVLLMMISNHYAVLTEAPNGWLLVGAIVVGGAALRHFLVRHEVGDPISRIAWTLPVIFVSLVIAWWLSGASLLSLDWPNLLLRWSHLIAGIAWIGTSFYFVALDFSLRKTAGEAGVAGEAWEVHGGGFYHVRKYLTAPERLPDDLIWFKWEAYLTWVTGFLLLVVLYYVQAETYLIDRAVADLASWQAIAISVASLAAGWLVYTSLCRSPLGRHTGLLAACLLATLFAGAAIDTGLRSGRGAFIHVGAFLGTIIAANVFMVLIPNQRRLTAPLLCG